MRLQDRPCARCVKRSIGHLCHDEPRESAKGTKQDQINTTSDRGAAVKQEDSLLLMLGPSLDQQQLDQRALQDAGVNITTTTVAPDSQTSNPRFLPQSSNPIAQGQGQGFGEGNQQCEKYTKSLNPMTLPTDGKRSRLRRLESWKSEFVFGYA